MVVVLEIELLGVKTLHLHCLVALLAPNRYISSSLIALAILREVIVSSSRDGLFVNRKRFSKPPFVKSAAVKMLVRKTQGCFS